MSNKAFQDCKALTCVEFHGTTNPTYGTNVFSGCTKIENIMVPDAYVDADDKFCDKNITQRGQFCPQNSISPAFSPTSISNIRNLLSSGYCFILLLFRSFE